MPGGIAEEAENRSFKANSPLRYCHRRKKWSLQTRSTYLKHGIEEMNYMTRSGLTLEKMVTRVITIDDAVGYFNNNKTYHSRDIKVMVKITDVGEQKNGRRKKCAAVNLWEFEPNVYGIFA